MKICIFGAGAVGAMIGGELVRVGHDVTLIARGPHLAAIQANGLTVILNGERRHSTPFATDDPEEAGLQDIVIFGVKTHQLAAASIQAQPLLGPETIIVAAQNGIPWWYRHGLDGPLATHTLTAIDPGDRVWKTLGPERVVGAVINGSCALEAPGIVDHHQTSRSLTIGEPLGGISQRCRDLAAIFAETDIEAPIAQDIRHALWAKLLNNIGVSTLCVLTRSALGKVNGDPRCFALAIQIMEETARVAARLGIDLSDAVAARIKGGPVSTTHKPSTLQDFEAGRPMEIDALVGAVIEIARLVGEPTPVIDNLYALLRRLAEETGTYPANPEFVLI
ncbi:MAG: 2-dehydropantoate 2-reductase [Proteobacteria bacterium]|nr:2-dehydropantoate 2-reductase [Pseudomonadota bacterium]MDA1323771.1 2-dehydropantoate 2-reductase [Pseudomonadota bacterium]